MATSIKFLAGDYGKEEYIYIKNKNQLRCSSKMFGAKELFLSSIASCEVANEESVKKLGGTLGGALVGGVLLGGIGAVAGAVAGGKTTESTVIIEFKNGNKALAKVNSPMMEVIRAHLFDEQLAQERGKPTPFAQQNKKKPSKAKKLLVLFVCLVVAGAWLNSRHPEGIAPQNTNSTNRAKNLSPDCEKIKTVKDWEQADTFWRIGHEECRPKAPEYNYTWTQKDIETFIKKSLPTYSKLGGYKLVFEKNSKNWCAIALVFPNPLNEMDTRRISNSGIRALENFFDANGAVKIVTARAYGKGQKGDMISMKIPGKESVHEYVPNYLKELQK